MHRDANDEFVIFAHARRLSESHQRVAFVKRACQGNLAQESRIFKLLAADREDEFDAAPVSPQCGGAIERPGEVIGNYRIVRELGEGGFGIVYEADQFAPLRRRVALKIIKPGMDTRAVLARFELECRVLATMDHPHIAKIYEAGVTPAGRPYFAMELVAGLPITTYCDLNQRTISERLELFAMLCDAVQDAHQKGVIHRDLKPSNLLVVANGQISEHLKIIDFGVAKSLAAEDSDRSSHTPLGVNVGTPAYMSPEQASGEVTDIDTRVDIYALGVVAYELLCGTTPIRFKPVHSLSGSSLYRQKVDRDPLPPSKRVMRLDARQGSQVSQQRGCQQRQLAMTLRGDLDLIVMKALNPDREQRYDSASDFARDVRRHLKHLPVEASPPSLRYRCGKWVRRHRSLACALIAGVTAVIGLIVSLTTATLMFSRTATREAELRKQTEASLQRSMDVLNSTLTTAAEHAAHTPGFQQAARQLMRAVRDEYEHLAAAHGDSPDVQLHLAIAWRNLADLQNAFHEGVDRDAFTHSIDILAKLAVAGEMAGNPRVELANAHYAYGYALLWDGQPEEAATQYQAGLAVLERVDRQPEKDRLRLRFHLDLSVAECFRGRVTPAEQHALQALRLAKSQAATDGRAWEVMALKQLASVRTDDNQYALATESLAEALRLSANPPLGPTHWTTLKCQEAMANVELASGKYDAAVARLRPVVPVFEEAIEKFPAFHVGQDLARIYNLIGRVESSRGHLEAASTALNGAVEHQLACNRTAHRKVVPSCQLILHRCELGNVLWRQGNQPAARTQYRSALAELEPLIEASPDHACVQRAQFKFLITCPDPELRDPAQLLDLAHSCHSANSAQSWRRLGFAYAQNEDWARSADAFEQVCDMRRGGDAVDWFSLAIAWAQLGDYDAARQWYAKAATAMAADMAINYADLGQRQFVIDLKERAAASLEAPAEGSTS